MATVYERREDGTYQRANEYEVGDLSVDEAIDMIANEARIDDVVLTIDQSPVGYGEDAVLIMHDGEPVMIIGT